MRGRARRLAAGLAVAALAPTACSSGSDRSTNAPPTTPTPSATQSVGGIDVVARVHLGGQPCGIAAAHGSVWVSDADKHRLFRIDPATNKARVVARLDPTPCEIAVGFGALWVVTQSGRLDRVDPRTGRVTARIRVGATSYEAVAAAGSVWVSNRNDGTVDRVDPATNRVVATVHLPDSPGGIAWGAGSLWVGNDTSGAAQVFRVDPRTRRFTRVSAGHRPAYIAVSFGHVFVSDVSDGTVTEIEPATDRTVHTVEVGLSPVNLVGGSHDVWVPDDIGNQVVRIDARTGQVVGRLNAGNGGPAVVTPAGNSVWVTLFEGGSVWRLKPST